MSYHAQGWAQLQTFGSPFRKGVMQALCYLMRDDELTVFAAIRKTERNKFSLEQLTEFEERAIQKTLKELAELGYLEDTGRRVNNMTVWRLPKYEEWLVRAYSESPPVQVGASETETTEQAQADDPSQENQQAHSDTDKPPPAGEGLGQAPPSRASSPPVQGTSPPVQGDQSSLNQGSTKPPRAISIEDWKAKSRVMTDRAPERASKDTPPGTALKAHHRFWKRMVDWYGKLWLVQTGEWPTAEWIRLLNLWGNDNGTWRELEKLFEAMTLDRPLKPPMLGEIEAIFRTVKAAGAKPYDEPLARAYWFNLVRSEMFAIARLYGLGAFGMTKISEITIEGQHQQSVYLRDRLVKLCDELVQNAIAGEKAYPPKPRKVLEAIMHDAVVAEFKPYAPEPLSRRPRTEEVA